MSHIIALYKYSARTVNILNSSNGATDKHKDKLQETFIRNNHFFDTKFYFQNSVLKLAINLIFLHWPYSTLRTVTQPTEN